MQAVGGLPTEANRESKPASFARTHGGTPAGWCPAPAAEGQGDGLRSASQRAIDKDDAAAAFAADFAAFKPLVLELRLDGVAPGKLAACGLAVINPPWRFEEAMREALPWIAAQLGPGVSWAVDAAPATPAAPASSG